MHAFRYILNQLIRTPSREWPWLPNELVHYIFDLAAASSLESCKSLTLVSSWARMIALPYLHPIVILEEPTEIKPFPFPPEVFDSRRRTSSPYTFTKYLFCDAETNAWFLHEKGVPRTLHPAVASIFCNCRYLQSIYIGVQLLSNTLQHCAAMHSPSASCAIRRNIELIIGMDDEPDRYNLSPVSGSFAQAFYHRVTHLRLQFASRINHLEILSYYPNVTHLAFYATIFHSSSIEAFKNTMKLLRSMTFLQTIVLMADSNKCWNIPFPPYATLLDLIRVFRDEDDRVLVAVTAITEMEVFIEESVRGSIWLEALACSDSVGLLAK